MREDVTKSLADLNTITVDLGDGTSAVITEIGGQYINLAEISNTNLAQGVTPAVKGVGTAMEGVETTTETAVEGTVGHEETLTEETEKNVGLQLEQINAVREGYRLVVVSAQTFLVDAMAAKLQAAETRVGRFANNMQTAMEHIKKQVESATESVNALKSAVDSLKSKTITITTRFKTVGKPSFNASGGATVVDGVTKIGNAIFGEAGPEAVIGVPLDPNKNRLSTPLPLGGGSSGVTEIHVHTHLDGREVARNQVRYIPDRFNAQT